MTFSLVSPPPPFLSPLTCLTEFKPPPSVHTPLPPCTPHSGYTAPWGGMKGGRYAWKARVELHQLLIAGHTHTHTHTSTHTHTPTHTHMQSGRLSWVSVMSWACTDDNATASKAWMWGQRLNVNVTSIQSELNWKDNYIDPAMIHSYNYSQVMLLYLTTYPIFFPLLVLCPSPTCVYHSSVLHLLSL